MWMKFRFFRFLLILINVLSTFAFTVSRSKSHIDENNNGFTPAPFTTVINKGVSSKSDLLQKCDPCPEGIKCVPHVQCPAHVKMAKQDQPQVCELKGGTHGLCCITGHNHTFFPKTWKLRHTKTDNTDKLMRSVVQEAKNQFTQVMKNEKKSKHHAKRGEAEFSHNLMFRSARHFDLLKTIAKSHLAIEEIFASRIFKRKENIPTEDFVYDQIDYGYEGTPMGQSCSTPQVQCNIYDKYRSSDGTCNNPQPHKTRLGSAGTAMHKLLPPAYDDGIWSPRQLSIDGAPLASPRLISHVLFDDINRPHPQLNLLVMQFGQIIAHDLTQTASITLANGDPISCCTQDGSSILPNEYLHFACLPIYIDPSDPFYSRFNQGCMNLVRSSLAPQDECKLSYGRQLSRVTHFLDGSMIYGSDTQTQSELREFKDGRLRVFYDYDHELLPLSKDKDDCVNVDKKSACYMSGDGRTNQIISLTTLHMVFVREHNRVAGILQNLNPHWSDELLFLEARRIVIAEYQVIVYNEWLPLIIGQEGMDRFDLHLHHGDYCYDYDSNVNPSVANEFTAAAFRFGHSTVDGRFVVQHKSNQEIIDIPDVMFNPSRLRLLHFYDEMLNTLHNQPMQAFDSSVSKGLTRYLFRNGMPFGLDLASLNIQRGRDHGLRPYNDYVEVGGRPRLHDFYEFGHDVGAKMASVYKFPDDVDLWVGGLHEVAANDALVGPTFVDIIGDQFSRLRRGDRYFFENGPQTNPGYFSLAQLNELRKVTISRIICDNSDRLFMNYIGSRGFFQPSSGNPLVSCDDVHQIPALDFIHWKE